MRSYIRDMESYIVSRICDFAYTNLVGWISTSKFCLSTKLSLKSGVRSLAINCPWSNINILWVNWIIRLHPCYPCYSEGKLFWISLLLEILWYYFVFTLNETGYTLFAYNTHSNLQFTNIFFVLWHAICMYLINIITRNNSVCSNTDVQSKWSLRTICFNMKLLKVWFHDGEIFGEKLCLRIADGCTWRILLNSPTFFAFEVSRTDFYSVAKRIFFSGNLICPYDACVKFFRAEIIRISPRNIARRIRPLALPVKCEKISSKLSGHGRSIIGRLAHHDVFVCSSLIISFATSSVAKVCKHE